MRRSASADYAGLYLPLHSKQDTQLGTSRCDHCVSPLGRDMTLNRPAGKRTKWARLIDALVTTTAVLAQSKFR